VIVEELFQCCLYHILCWLCTFLSMVVQTNDYGLNYSNFVYKLFEIRKQQECFDFIRIESISYILTYYKVL
jgi:hypothetical protein